MISRRPLCKMLQRFWKFTSGRQTHTAPTVTAGPAALIEEELRMRVGDIDYVLIPRACPSITFTGDPSLFIVYETKPGQVISREALSIFRQNLGRDDVFQPAFATNIVFYGSSKRSLIISKDVHEELEDWGTKQCNFIQGDPADRVAPGPYVYAKGGIWQPWRVYYDVNSTFMSTFKPSPTNGLARLEHTEAGAGGRVIVPSRCYYKPSASRPLHGLRVAVKDNMDIKGHKTTLNNRAWRDFWPPASENAHCVQQLIDAGAIIVGKVKLQAMIVREEPVEAVEYTDPFNPRGDGYQVPSGSSSGSAAAIASYNWLDLSLGSDTNGSVRKPAHYNGCHTIRPSTGIMNTEGVVGFFPEFDMPGFFGRDLARFPEILSVWYGKSPMLIPSSEKSVTKILYPKDYLPTPHAGQTAVIEEFVTALETSLDVKRSSVSIAELWKEHLPDGPEHDDISKYLETAGCYPFFHDSYKASEPFRDGYKKKFGKPPFVHRFEHWLWDEGNSISQEERDECWRRCEVYRLWLLDSIFKPTSQDGLTIMILPIEVGKPNYRDAREPRYGILNGYDSLNLSPIMRAPEVTAIVGQTTFMSEVTKQSAPYPIAASVIGSPGKELFYCRSRATYFMKTNTDAIGSDSIITNVTIDAMKKAGIPVELKTGESVY
ncbi:amidase [Xylaria intraflava]|nr:amidase [Xylaria intraflava]